MKSRLADLTLVERYALGQIGRVRQSRGTWKFDLGLLRDREVEKIIRSRHGKGIPNPEGTEDREGCLAYLRVIASSKKQDLRAWCRRWAPWVTTEVIERVGQEAGRRKRMMNSNGAAGLLMVTMAERTNLGLRTIGACDMSAQARKKQARQTKRERDRQRMCRVRKTTKRKDGTPRQDRESYVAESVSRTRPWEAEEISRRTWYRRRTDGTGTSRIDIIINGDQLVPTPDDRTPPVPVLESPNT